jgi:peptidoglycan/LPS O-acetylase OafA/YrhL
VTDASRKPIRGYLPTLDGWRAMAILIVLCGHDTIHYLGPFSTVWIAQRGDRGVQLFFALSGILICSRLLDEEEVRGRIDIKGFYIRRVCRIQPAALAYLAVVSGLMMLNVITRAPKEVSSAVLLVRNILPLHASMSAWYTAHYWSLSVEEHFYLLLPGFLVLSRKFRLWLLAPVVLLLEIWRYIVLVHPQLQFGWNLVFRTDMAVQGILLAALAALLLRRLDVKDWCVRWLRPWVALIFAAIVWTATDIHQGRFNHFALLCTYPPLIVSTMLHPNSLTGRFLELPPMRFLGRISYSLYLWQMLFFVWYPKLQPPNSHLLALLQNTWLRYLATLLLSLLSYYLLEKPMIRLGHRLATPVTPGREDLGESNEVRETIPANVSSSTVV